ncbi:hypothetical protein GYMLUDRAFT_37368 [Collybiopsis luxurians FD-317 M1]|nr:hypothetical protein GYMLUDRAFT_37368 [Collybiopsis luxurians FD-317 M1]
MHSKANHNNHLLPNHSLSHQHPATLSPSTSILHSSGLPLLNPEDSFLTLPTLATALTPPTQPESRLTYITSSKAAQSLTVSCLPLVTHIQLCVCGELFSYDLSALQSDPQEIIELLKCTASERGNWMIVAATYRRIQNSQAAVTVLQAMLQVMAHHGIPEQELKPAFLLLSACETDLGKLTRAQGTVSHDHYQKAQKWLQKVHGTMRRPTVPINALSTCSVESRLQKFGLPPTPPSPVVALPSRPTSPLHSDKREIQSLRNQLRHQSNALTEALASKRKLEDRYELERDTRRRLEYTIDSLKRERDSARRMEIDALEQMKRETEIRRRVEEKLMYEKDLRMELERYTKIPRRSLSPYPSHLQIYPV